MKHTKQISTAQMIPLIFMWSMLCLNIPSQAAGIVTSPEKMNYQAVARDATGSPLISQSITGLFSTAIGSGTITTGTWAAISWFTTAHYLQVELDPAGGSAWLDMGTSQLLSVPYSYYANTALSSLDNRWDYASGNLWYNNISGNVGIGTASPTHRLDIKDASTGPFMGILSVTANQAASSLSDAYAVYGENNIDDFYGIGGMFRGGYEGVVGEVTPTG